PVAGGRAGELVVRPLVRQAQRHRDRDVSDEKQHQAAPPARTRLSAASVHVPLPSPAKRIPPSGSVGASPHGRRRVRRAQRRKPPGPPAEKAARPRGELPPERNQGLAAVPGAGLEPARLSAAAFKAAVSTGSTTRAPAPTVT